MAIHQHFSKAFAFVVSVGLLALLLSQVEMDNLTSTLRSIEPEYVLFGLTAFALSYFFRALRFYSLLNEEIGAADLFAIVCVHNMINGIMPARTGELSYIYLLKKIHNRSIGDGAVSLILARMMDILSIFVLFFAAVILAEELPETISGVVSAIAISAALVVLFFSALIIGRRSFARTLDRLAVRRLSLEKTSFISRSINGLKEAESSIGPVGIRRVLLLTLTLSLLIWVCQYLMYYVLLRGLGLDLNIILIVLGTTFAIFTSIVPLPSVGSFGVYEGLWTISFVALGFPKEVAISTGFAIHMIFIVYLMLLGLIGFYKIGLRL